MYIKILFILLFFISGLFAQWQKVRGRDLLPSAKDTINAFIEDSIWSNAKEYWIKIDFTEAQVKVVFDSIDAQASTTPVILRLEKGYHTWRGDEYYALNGCDRIHIDLTGVTIDMADRAWEISSNPVGIQDNGAGGWAGESWNWVSGAKGGTDFTTALMKDSIWVGVSDTTGWDDIEFGDLITFGDSADYMYADYGVNGYIGFFDSWADNSQGADSGKMILKNPAFTTVNIQNLNRPHSSDSGVDTAEEINNSSDPVTFTCDAAITTQILVGHILRMDSEDLRVTSISGTSVTATRAVSGTTIATHVTNSDIYRRSGNVQVVKMKNKVASLTGGYIKNGNITFTGFDVVQTNNTFMELDSAGITDGQTAMSQAWGALGFEYCNSVNVVNHTAKDYFSRGGGYGLYAGPAVHSINGVNLTFRDCRHAFTTGAWPFTWGVNYIRLQNVIASGSQQGRDNFLTSAFDTHRGSRYFEIDGFYIDGYTMGFQLRAEEIVIKNGKARLPNIFCNLGSSAAVKEEKKSCVIQNVDLYGVRTIIAPGTGAKYKYIDIDNMRAWCKVETPVTINYYHSGFLITTTGSVDSLEIDSLDVRNSKFYGVYYSDLEDLEKYFTSYEGANPGQPYNYVSFDNCTFNNFRFLFKGDSIITPEFHFTNNKVVHNEWFFSFTGDIDDSSNVIMENYHISNNFFKDVLALSGFGNSRVDNLLVENNIFDNCGNLFLTPTYNYVGDNILIKNNTIKNYDTHDSYRTPIQWAGSYGVGPITHIGNVYETGTFSGYGIRILTNNGYSPILRLIENKFLNITPGSFFMHFIGNARVDIIKNTFILDATGTADGFLYMDSATVRLIDNYIYQYTASGAIDFVSLKDTTDHLTISGNTFISAGSPTGPDAIQASVGGTIVAGENETNFATPVDTTGFGAAGGTWTSMTKFGD